MLVAAGVASVFQVDAMRAIAREDYGSAGGRAARGLLGWLPIVAFAAGAVLVLAGAHGAGLLAVAFGSVLAVVVAIVMAWVVLVEVLR